MVQGVQGVLVLFMAALLASPAAAQEHQHAGKLGTVRFANSCSADAQPAFAHGMALLHSFEFGPAMDAFAEVVRTDPSCGIALWATGIAQWGNPFSIAIRPAAQMQAGRAPLGAPAPPAAETARGARHHPPRGLLFR